MTNIGTLNWEDFDGPMMIIYQYHPYKMLASGMILQSSLSRPKDFLESIFCRCNAEMATVFVKDPPFLVDRSVVTLW